jgi:tellurite resistance protein
VSTSADRIPFHVMTAKMIIAASDGVLTRIELDTLLANVNLGSRSPEEVLDMLERHLQMVLSVSEPERLLMLQEMRAQTLEAKQHLILACMVTAHADGTPDAARRTLLERIAHAVGLSDSEYQRYTARIEAAL